MNLKCIAVDDEYLALDVIREYIRKVPFLELKQTFDSALPAITYLKQNQIDLLFLDIQMKELTGLQLLKSLNHPPLVIFTTAYDQYAVESYELDVLDYLMKPISFERFVRSVDKACNRLLQEKPGEGRKNQEITISNKAEDFFFVKSGTILERVSYDEILYIKGERDYLKIVTPKKNILSLSKFRHFEDLLPENRFFRVHKSYVVAMDKIHKIDGHLIYLAGVQIPIGATYRNQFLEEVMKQR